MVTTKIWAIKDSISRVISYAKNPDKTTFADLKQVLKYAENDKKTIDEVMEMCINYGQFKKIMLKKGYIINDDYNRKYPTIRSVNDKKQ